MTDPKQPPVPDQQLADLLEDAARVEQERVTREPSEQYEVYGPADMHTDWYVCLSPDTTRALVAEVRTARRLVRGLYLHMADAAGEEQLQAELERYAGALGIIRPGRPDTH